MDSSTSYYITLQVRASALLRAVESYLERPWSRDRFRKMKDAAVFLRKWMPKLEPQSEHEQEAE